MMHQAANLNRREWTRADAVNWLSRVVDGYERHGLKACSAFSYLIKTGFSKIAYAMMAAIKNRLGNTEGRTHE